MQIWADARNYDELLNFCNGVDIGKESPDGDGHSVIYLGRNDKNKHIFAEQSSSPTVLEPTSLVGFYKYWIAAQFYDAEGIAFPGQQA